MANDMAAADSAQSPEAALKDRLRRGVYRPGERLTEMEIADAFGIGRGRVREVFRTLAGEGYLTFSANRGVQVRRYSRAEMLEMGRVREVLEGLAARLAAERALPPEERAGLERHQAAMDRLEARRDAPAFHEENRAYHETICRLAGSQHVTEFLTRLRLHLFHIQLPPSFLDDSLTRSNADHRVITAAILSGSADAAEAAMRAHVRAGNAHIASLDESAFG